MTISAKIVSIAESNAAPIDSNFKFALIDPEEHPLPELPGVGRARTPQQGLNAQNQLAHAEWLDQIVVGSKLQTFNPLAGFTSGGKDEDRK